MKKQMVSSVVSGAMLAAAGAVSASEPVALDASQMDKVTAAGSAAATAAATAVGQILAATSTSTIAYVVALPAIPTQGGQLLPTVSVAAAASASASQ
ncbi:hypothetical protein [Methylohalobius crimeensis]|uniref:hypothetical protein n=1 Tax=Methylohalobius crimeensis TaxID=244365 RepID=UPI0003B3CB11|nr:hypothetical protein [Methylohalobius crimeensis]